MTILLNNVDVDTTTAGEKLGQGGPKIIFIRGDDFGGGELRIQLAPPSDPQNRFEDIRDGTFVQDAEVHIDYLPPGTNIRVVFEGSTGASNVFVEIL